MFVVNDEAVVFEDKDDIKYKSWATFATERDAIEHALGMLNQKRDALARQMEKANERLRRLPLRYPIGAQVVVGGREAIVVKLDQQDSLYPYLVFFPDDTSYDWFESSEVKPCQP